MTVRAYLPTTFRLLREARERGRFGPAPLAGHAVTAALVELAEGAGEEELEWAAAAAASVASLRLLADEMAGEPAGDTGPRRVVAAVDVPSVQPASGTTSREDDPSAVLLQEVPLRRLAALLVDDPAAAPVVAAARDALAAGADEDDPVVERCLDEDLGWYAASELDALLAQPPGDDAGS